MLRFLTDFADQGVILPVAATVVVSLVMQRWWRAAAGWSVAAGSVLCIMLSVKLAFAACGGFVVAEDVRNPSGHTATAALVVGVLAGVLAHNTRRPAAASILAGLGAATLIGITRVVLHEHSVGDVIAATPIGIGGAWLAVRLMGPPPSNLRPWRVIVPAMLIAALMHGTHLPVEMAIRGFANRASNQLSFCQLEPSKIQF